MFIYHFFLTFASLTRWQSYAGKNWDTLYIKYASGQSLHTDIKSGRQQPVLVINVIRY